MLQFAMELALRSHRGQYRKDGRPYALHPFNVISRLANWDIDDEITLSAAALHDVEEENPNKRYLIDFISMYPLGPNDAAKEVYRIVLEELTFIPDNPNCKWQTKSDYISSFSSASLRALVVKIADRLENSNDYYIGNDKQYAAKYFKKGTPLFDAALARKAAIEECYGNKTYQAIIDDIEFMKSKLEQK